MTSFTPLEIESLLPEPVSRSVVRIGRIRSLLVVICCLVALALGLNLIASAKMNRDPANNETKANRTYVKDQLVDKVLQSAARPTQRPQRTTPPTPTPTTLKPSVSRHTSNATKPDTAHTNTNFSRSEIITPPPPMSNTSRTFIDRWCDLQGVDWYPHSESKEWQRRAPCFLLPGAKYSGTSTLAKYLTQHPQIVPPTFLELKFFYEANFRRYVTTNEKTKVLLARERMYARDYPISQLKNNPNTISFDATPGYLFYSSLLPRRILCVVPWIKLVVLLRNPSDRLYEHYLSAVKKGLKLSFEEWIEKDFALMREVGFLNSTNSDFWGSKEEDVAWYEYQTSSLEGAVGRSLYEIQLRQWFQGFQHAGQDPALQVLIVHSERLKQRPQREYSRILKFLGMPDYQPKSFQPSLGHQSKNQTSMHPKTKKRLDDFFRPYNQRLRSLLKAYGLSTANNNE